jgi:hypothetical protein
MPRKAVEVDRNFLTQAINVVEGGGPLENQSRLFQEVADIYNSERGEREEVTASVVALRIKEWAIPVKTPKGKRGRQMSPEHLAKLQASRAGKKMGRGQKFSLPVYQKSFTAMRKRMPDEETLIVQVEQGSMKAAIKLMCHQCMGFDELPKMIRGCTALACPLWPFRPFKSNAEKEEINGLGGA